MSTNAARLSCSLTLTVPSLVVLISEMQAAVSSSKQSDANS